jgi:hypothetical protein
MGEFHEQPQDQWPGAFLTDVVRAVLLRSEFAHAYAQRPMAWCHTYQPPRFTSLLRTLSD